MIFHRHKRCVKSAPSYFQTSGQPIVIQPIESTPKAFQTIIEDVNPIVEKCKIKAFTPLVTIKNFFKPVSKSQVTGAQDKKLLNADCSTDELCRSGKNNTKKPLGILGDKLKNVKENDKMESNKKTFDVKKEVAQEVVCVNDENSNQSMKDFQLETKSEKTDPAGENKNTSNESHGKSSVRLGHVTNEKDETNELGQDCGMLVGNHTSKLACSQTTNNNDVGNTKAKLDFSSSKKRPLSSTSIKGNATKKAKQSSLFSSFAKQKSLTDLENKKGKTCPICSKEFPPTAWNKEINDHIDNCLIE